MDIPAALKFARKIFGCCPEEPDKAKGMMSGLSILFLLMFTILGLGMLTTTQVHMYLCGHRKNSLLIRYASENGIKKSFHKMLG